MLYLCLLFFVYICMILSVTKLIRSIIDSLLFIVGAHKMSKHSDRYSRPSERDIWRRDEATLLRQWGSDWPSADVLRRTDLWTGLFYGAECCSGEILYRSWQNASDKRISKVYQVEIWIESPSKVNTLLMFCDEPTAGLEWTRLWRWFVYGLGWYRFLCGFNWCRAVVFPA